MMDYIQQIREFIPITAQESLDKLNILEMINQYPDNILLRDNKIAHITSSGLIVNPDHTKILMVHHNIYNTWTWTGGHADGDHDLLQVAIKEAKEETGVEAVKAYSNNILSLDILPVYGHVKNGEYVSAHLHLSAAFLLIAPEGLPLIINQNENSGVCWVDLKEVDKFSDEPFMINIYNKILQRII